MAHKWFTIIIVFFTCLIIFTVILCVLLKFFVLNQPSPNTSITTHTTTITNSIIACEPICQEYQACVNRTCITDGKLVISLTWSRSGDADLVVRTPSEKIISRRNQGPNNNTDQGQLALDKVTGTGPEDIFWNKSITPPSGTYFICAETHFFSPALNTINPVTFTVQARTLSGKTQVFTKTMTQNGVSDSSCSYTSITLVAMYLYS